MGGGVRVFQIFSFRVGGASPLCVQWCAPSDAVEDVMTGKAVPRFPEPWLRWEARWGGEGDSSPVPPRLSVLSSADVCTLVCLHFAATSVTPFLKHLSSRSLFPSPPPPPLRSDSWLLPDHFCPSRPRAVSVWRGSGPALTFPDPSPVPWGSSRLGKLHLSSPPCPCGGCLLALLPLSSPTPAFPRRLHEPSSRVFV